MKLIRMFVYGLLYGHHANMALQYRDWFEIGALNGDRKEMELCNRRYAKHMAKEAKLYLKMESIRNRKKGA